MLRYLFLDMNSFFASVEQQERPELRGRPVGVIPTEAATTCCIAASYEAKAYGVKTGTGVVEAHRLCPDIQIALARPKIYVEYHHRIIEAVEKCIHVEQVCSIDEMYARLMRNERDVAWDIARAVKASIREACGPYVRCSVGLGPNVWLAKVATDLEKPDGLATILPEELPGKISGFELTDLPGIARGYDRRLRAHGITTIEALYAASEQRLARVFGSKVIAATWWRQLHGYDLAPLATQRRTVGHSHVLPPPQRNDEAAFGVMVRMTHKAAYRMRRLGYWAGRVTCNVLFVGGGQWEKKLAILPTRDTLTLVDTVMTLWRHKTTGKPLRVSVTLSHLVSDESATIPLFACERQRCRLADAMDRIDDRYGVQTVYSCAMIGYADSAPVRISYTQIPQRYEFGAE